MRNVLRITTAIAMLMARPSIGAAQYLGQLSANPYAANSTSNQLGPYGSPYGPESVNNLFGQFGSSFSPKSASNPYAVNAPKLYDDKGSYHGRLSANQFDPDSTSNPFGRYGSPFSPDSINNRFGAGSPYRADSPNNPFGRGWSMYGESR